MKKIKILALCLGLAIGASAQHGHSVGGGFHGPVYAYQPRVIVSTGFYAPFYGSFGYYGLPYWGLPYGMYYPYGMAYNHTSKLQKKEDDIRADYADRIYSVKHDNSLTSKQKRENIRSLKDQRKKDIQDLKANYHKQPVNP